MLALPNQAFSAPRTVCEHEEGPKDKRPARNESAAPMVATVGKQSPYNPGEM
ncbi:hypothetical protein GCM10022233_04520 [Streptomyces shaanxiensis]|uniref:Uncharacterized protein n=1 Tax=Streptomyces shaanxiensis TaxID=653357 RepID=A0ABP7UAT0_9ACTN